MEKDFDIEQEMTGMVKVLLSLIADDIEYKAKSVEEAVKIVRDCAAQLG